MKNFEELFENLRRLDLSKIEVQDSLYRISNWMSDKEHSVSDDYVQNQFKFLDKLISSAEKENINYYTIDTINQALNNNINDLANDFLKILQQRDIYNNYTSTYQNENFDLER